MNNIINLHENLTKSTTATKLNNTTAYAEFYENQVHQINLRTNYYKAQLDILAAHTTFNSVLEKSEHHDDISWRAAEATLENLYLEYHYHTIKFQELLNTEDNRFHDFSTPIKDSDPDVTLSHKQSRAILLKPLRTSEKRISRLLETPPTSPATTVVSHDTPLNPKNLYDILEQTHPKQHKRSNSMPDTPNLVTDSDLDLLVELDLHRNIRHFMSCDTGLKRCLDSDIHISFDDSSMMKESEIFGSFDDRDLESVTSYGGFTIDDIDDPIEELRPKSIKRSTSHESIFELKKPSKPTSPWLEQLNMQNQPTVEVFNITANKAEPQVTTVPSKPVKVKSDEFFQNFNQFLIPSSRTIKKNIHSATTSKQLLDAVVTNSYMKKCEQNSNSTRSDEHTHPQSKLSSSLIEENFTSQWSNIFNKLRPQNLVPSSSLVTSEIGKPLTGQSNLGRNFEKKRDTSSKGSYSTLTIGPNHSRTINYGIVSDLSYSDVLSSEVSHEELTDALNDISFY